MNYESITNELWVDYKVMDVNPCEWTPFIMFDVNVYDIWLSKCFF
jgi:hypothetical protein